MKGIIEPCADISDDIQKNFKEQNSLEQIRANPFNVDVIFGGFAYRDLYMVEKWIATILKKETKR